MPLTDITVVGAGGSKARKSTSRARNKQRVGKENVPSSKSGDGTKQTKQTRQRRPKATGTEEIIIKRTINSIAESVMKEREEKGKADVASKIKEWNKLMVNAEHMQITRHQINSYINNTTRKKAREQNEASRGASNGKSLDDSLNAQSARPTTGTASRPTASSVRQMPSVQAPSHGATSLPPVEPQYPPRRPIPPRPEGIPDNYRPCAAGDLCCMNTGLQQWPGWADSQHKCPHCHKKGVTNHIHTLCGIESKVDDLGPKSDYVGVDEEVDIPWSRTCHQCAAVISRTEQAGTASNPIATQAADSALQESSTDQPKKKVGRPKGSTNEAKRQQNDLEIEAKNYVAEQWFLRSEQAKKEGKKQLPRGTVPELVAKAKELFGITNPNFNVPKQTISGRKKSTRLRVQHRGTASPMAPVEGIIKDIIIQANRMNFTMSKPEVIELANGIIQGTEYEDVVKEFKASRAHVESADDIKELLGDAWYRGFMKRHDAELSKKKRKIFCTNRANGTKYEDYELMYDAMDDVVVSSGNGEYYEEPVWMTLNAKVTDDETEAVGHPVRVNVTDPDNFIFFDEVGSNTNMKDDGHVGGEIFICEKGSNANILAAIKDEHFTVLGITSGSGLPVMVAIIYKAKEVGETWKDGFDVFAEDQGIGEGKMFPGGPTVTFKGQKVPVYVNCSDSGSICSAILADMFKTMDDAKLFNRGEGQCPVAMVDGHISRLGLPFLDYINAEETRWKVLLGVPNQTQYWQLGDSSEQNGCFKMALTKWKRDLIRRKKAHGGVPVCIENLEVVWGVRIACEQSFFRREHNIRAMARRGLGITLNRGCLDIPEVLRTASLEVQTQRAEELARRKNKLWSSVTPQPIVISATPEVADMAKLNLKSGFCADFISLLTQEHKKQGGDKLHEERKRLAAIAKRNLEAIGKCTAGTIYTASKAGEDISPVLEGRIHDFVRNREAVKEGKEADKKKAFLQKRRATKASVEKIRRTSKYKRLAKKPAWINNNVAELKRLLNTDERSSPFFFSNNDLKILVAWKKIRADGKMPTKKVKLVDLFLKTRTREEPILPADDYNAEGAAASRSQSEGGNDDIVGDGEDNTNDDGEADDISVDEEEASFKDDDDDESDLDTDDKDSDNEFDDDPFRAAPTRKQPARGTKRKQTAQSESSGESESDASSDEEASAQTRTRRACRGRRGGAPRRKK